MEFIENFFGKVWITKSQKIQRKATTVYLKQIKEYLATIACYISTNNVEGIVASKNYAGFVDQHLYLPTWIGCTESRDINKKAYLYLSLISCAAKQLNLKSNVLNESKIARRMECVKYYSVINKQLDKIFPHFQAFQQNFISDIKNNLKVSSNSAEYAHWQCAVLSRETQGPSITNHYLASLKSKDTVPDFLIVTTVDLPQETFSYVSSNAEVPSNTSTKDMTEQEKLENSPTKRIDLEKEKKDSNPVTHAFEKLNTADDYGGGYRFDSGDDELEDHSNALKELEMSAVTTGGEAAKSIYSSDIQQSFLFAKAKNKQAPASFSYPEWFSKRSTYSSDHCTLFEIKSLVTASATTKLRVEKKYRHLICQHETELDRILNQPTWLKRQNEGTELDIDECVKYQADILSKNTSQVPKLYTTKNKTWLDVEISILFDQSLSTDSWIDNMRICDVIKESLVMMGILFEEILPKISVAGTWSVTRKRCLYNIVKEREDTWDSFYRKVDSIEPQGYTRLGPAIRHINRLMKLSTTSKKILIVLTDGKPSDIDSYEGYHGVQDVKKACMELEEEGVVPIAIVIDRDIKGRFNTMFKNHFIITDPKKLPEQLFSVIKTFIR